jgi:hypothetical protein
VTEYRTPQDFRAALETRPTEIAISSGRTALPVSSHGVAHADDLDAAAIEIKDRLKVADHALPKRSSAHSRRPFAVAVAAVGSTAYNRVAMAIPHKLVTELLGLPDEERGALAVLLLRSLEPDDGDELTGKEWEEIWGAEIDRRMHEVTEGSVELIDGDQVAAEVRAMLDAPMP